MFSCSYLSASGQNPRTPSPEAGLEDKAASGVCERVQVSRHRGRDAPPATQRARAAPGAHAHPRRGPALGRGRQRAGSGRRARRAAREAASRVAGRTREWPSQPGRLVRGVGDARGSRVRATLLSANFVRMPGGLGAQGGRGWGSRTSAGGGGSMHPRPAPPAPGNTWLSAMPSTQLERLSAVVDWCAVLTYGSYFS